MPFKAEDIELKHQIIGRKHVITSPDVPELHVSADTREMAEADVQPALDALQRVKDRIDSKHDLARAISPQKGRLVA